MAANATEPDLVFVHGGSHGSWCWDRLIRHLEGAGYAGRMIALDVPGCGAKRARHGEAITLAQIAAELNGDVRAAGLGEPGLVVVGHSLAGILLPMLHADDPALYDAFVFLSASAPAEGQSVMDLMGDRPHGADPARVGWPLDPAATPRRDLWAAMFCDDLDTATCDWLLDEAERDHWPPAAAEPVWRGDFATAARSSYIVCGRDRILPVAWQGRFAERLGCDSLYVMDSPHEPFVSHVPQLAALLRGRVLPAQ
jgi:pimeloyl-ACP methyl ester carboxylesterase